MAIDVTTTTPTVAAIDVVVSGPLIVIDIAEVSGPRGDPGTPGEPGPVGPVGPPGPAQPEAAGTMIVQAIDEPPDPGLEGVQWYDPSSGDTRVWYDNAWQPVGVPAANSPTLLAGQEVGVEVGIALILNKQLDLPVPYFDGGNAYWTQFPLAFANGMSSPSYFPFGVFFSPAQGNHAPLLAAAGITNYDALETNLGNIEYARAAGIRAYPQTNFWSADMVDVEDGDNDPLVCAWYLPDEADMFSNLGNVIADQAAARAHNDGRFTSMNVGQGITGNSLWNPTTIDDMVRVPDTCTVDGYAYSSVIIRASYASSAFWTGDTDPDLIRRSATYGWQADRMRSFQDPGNLKPYGVVVECAKPFLFAPEETTPHITLPEISGAVWSAIRHGARTIAFFQHNNDPEIHFYSLSGEGFPITDYSGPGVTYIRNHVTDLTSEVTALAEVIDGPTYEWDFGDANVDTMLKAYDGDAYIFAGTSLSSILPGRGTTDIEQVGEVLEFQFTDTSETGTVSSAIEVAADVELVVVAVSGRHGTNNGFASMTFTQSGIDTAMTKATGGDASGASWQSAIFYMVLPDTGASKSLKWDWLGAAGDGERVIAVTFWKGIDLAIPVRDSDGFQDTGFALETTILVETSALDVADGDLVLGFCGMYNPDEDGLAKVNVFHHMIKLADLDYEGSAEGMLATATPDGNCTFGFTNVTVATEAAFVAIVLKQATLQAVTSTITKVGTTINTSTNSNASAGTFYTYVDVPVGTEIALCAVFGRTGTDDGYETISMYKSGVLTPMTKLNSADGDADVWGSALFYMIEPDIAPSGNPTWDWAGASNSITNHVASFTFWAGVDLVDPIRDSDGDQRHIQYVGGPIAELPLELPMLTNREGDLIVAFSGGGRAGFAEGSFDDWKNLTVLEQALAVDFFDFAWATSEVIGSVTVALVEITNIYDCSLCAVVLKPAAAVTPATPDVEPPTTDRSIITATFTLPPDLAGATDVEVLNESRTIPVVAGEFEDTFDEEFIYHNYRIPI